MAYYSLFPSKDATLYSHPERKLMNSGKRTLICWIRSKVNYREIDYGLLEIYLVLEYLINLKYKSNINYIIN